MRHFIALTLLFWTSGALAKDCFQKIVKDSIKIEWTGYKFTEKEGVTGQFEKLKIMNGESGPTIQKAVEKLSFVIDGLKFDAGNFVRNANLKKSFFKLFADKATIKGNVQGELKGDKGELSLALHLNGVEKRIPMNYVVAGQKFTATGSLSMDDFNLQKAYEAISKACAKLHTGKDGISKTWKTVDLKAYAEFEEVCK